MPTPTTANLPKPKSPDEFEDIVLDALKLRWKDPHATRYGRSGQRQYGVDILGHPSRLDGQLSGAQCKARKLSVPLLVDEIDKAKTFRPKLSELLLVTTDSRDAELQATVLQHLENNPPPFRVEILFWEDVVLELAANADLIRKHWPGFFLGDKDDENSLLKSESRQLWCWHSTTQSVQEEQVSVLACIETLLASSVALFLATSGTFPGYVFYLAFFAPLVLLRSDASTLTGIRWLAHWHAGRYNYDTPRHQYGRGVRLLIYGAVVIFSVRVASALFTVFRHPIESLCQIPFNYQRYALHIDALYPPEMIPGVEQYSQNHEPEDLLAMMRLRNIVDRFTSRFWLVTGIKRVIRTFIFCLIFVFLFVPSLALRFAVKSTSILYVPFILLCKGVSFDDVSCETRLRRIYRKRLSFLYALIGIIGLGAILPIAVASLAESIVASCESHVALRALLGYFTFVPTIERWNVVHLLCAAITVLLFLIARRALADRHDSHVSMLVKYENAVDKTVRFLNAIRAIGVMYVVLCGIIVFSKVAADVVIVFPRIGTHWLP